MLQKSIHTPQQQALQRLLRDIRTEAGYTQWQLADKLGVPQSRISDYERGESLPDILILRQYMAVQGLTLPHFVDRLEAILQDLEKA